MSFAAAVKAHKTKAVTTLDTIVKETVETFSLRLVVDWTPYGDPLLWKSPPPADYRPGNLQSSWFYSEGRPSGEKTSRVDILAVNNLDRMSERPAGKKHYLSNSADHAGAIQGGHSSQAPAGILVNAQEFAPMAYSIARRVTK